MTGENSGLSSLITNNMKKKWAALRLCIIA